MASHRFHVGQKLDFSPRQMGTREGVRACEVVRRMPIEGGQPQYRIKCAAETTERVAKESQLSVRS